MEEYPQEPEEQIQSADGEDSPLWRRWWEKVSTFWQNIRSREPKAAPQEEPPYPKERPPAPKEGRPSPEAPQPWWRRLFRRRAKSPPPDPEEIARWVALLAHPNDPAHARALDELVVIGRPAIPQLIDALNSDTWIQAFRATEALGMIGSQRATRPLMRLLNHPNSNVRWGAAEALGRLQNRWARGRLRRSANEDESRTSWGETVAEAAERAVASIDQTWTSRLINLLQILLLLTICAIIVLTAAGFIRQELHRRAQFTPTPTVTVTPTVTATPSPTQTPLPDFVFQPITATVSSARANVRDLPNTTDSTVIGVLNFGDEIFIYGGRLGEDGTWWYLMRLLRIINPNTDAPVLEDGAYGWIHESLLAGTDTPNLAPTVGAIETIRAGLATPTPLGSSLEMPTPEPTAVLTPTVSP